MGVQEGHRQQKMGQRLETLWGTVPILQTVLTLHGRQASRIQPHQKHKRRSRQDIKIRKRRDYDVFRGSLATPIAAQPNERGQKTGPRNGTAVNKKNGGADDGDVQ